MELNQNDCVMEVTLTAFCQDRFEKAVMECKVISKTPEMLNQCYGRVANLEKNKTKQRQDAKYERNDDLQIQIMDGGHWWY